MAAPADYWDTFDLKAVTRGGLVNEDVMQQIWNISAIPLPFTDRIGSSSCSNSFTEWTEDTLAAPSLANAVVSGVDASVYNTGGGARVGNHLQNSIKTLAVTERAQSTNQIGRSNEMSYQLMMRQQELRRDVEAIALSPQASVADNNNNTAGKAGGFDAWLTSNTNNGLTGANGGFNFTTGIVAAPDPGDARPATMAALTGVIQSCYLNNGDISVLMARPAQIAGLNKLILATPTTAKVATPTANVNGAGNGVGQTAQGYVSVMITDFGTSLELVPNRLQQTYQSTDTSPVPASSILLIDPQHVGLGYLKGYQTRPLAKLGLSERSMISVDWTVKVFVEKAHGVIRCVTDAAWTA